MNDTTIINHHNDWRTYRKDNHLRAHSILKGNIVAPRVEWSLPIGGTLQEVVNIPPEACDGESQILLCYGGVIIRATLNGEHLWRSAPLGIHGITGVFDIDGDGAFEIVAANGLEVFVLALATGKMLWSKRFEPPELYGVYSTTLRVHKFFPERRGMQMIVPALHTRSVFFFDFSDGAANGKFLHAFEMGDAFHPTVAIGDVDNDGAEEIIVTRLGSAAVFDPRSGKQKSSTTWETDGTRRRGYGQIMLRDIDGDGVLELIILARQVTRHIAVLTNDGRGNFSPRWDRLIEHIYPTDHTDLRYCKKSICTIDGNTILIVSIFDDRNDNRWRTEMIDANSGATIDELDDMIVCDIREHDGAVDLLAMHAATRNPEALGRVHLLRRIGGEWKTAWSHEHARFAFRTIGQTASIGKYRPALFEADGVWSDSRGCFFFDEANKLFHVDAGSFQKAIVFEPRENIIGKSLITAITNDAIIISESSGIISVIGENQQPTSFASGASIITDGHPVEHPSPTPVVFTTSDHRRFIAMPDNSDTIALYECVGYAAPILKWRVPGRGKIGFDRTHHCVSIDDINNDGEPEIIFAIPGEHSILVAMSVEGKIISRFDFPELPSITLGARTGCYDWMVFDDGDQKKIYVAGYRSDSMNSEISFCLDAASGKIIWSRDIVGEEMEGVGFGPWGIASCDGTTGFFCAKGYVCIVDLRTGKLLQPFISLTELTRNTMKANGTYLAEGVATWVTKDDPFTAYGSIILNDIDNDGALELIITGCLGGFGVLRGDGTPVWWKSAPLTGFAYRLGAVCDVDGDGVAELGLGHSSGDFICYNVCTGEEKWRINLGPTTIDCSSCDIDGDGRDEFICRTTDGKLLALGVDASGAPIIKWKLQFDFFVGNPVIADCNGNNSAEIFCVIGDGRLVKIGGS